MVIDKQSELEEPKLRAQSLREESGGPWRETNRSARVVKKWSHILVEQDLVKQGN